MKLWKISVWHRNQFTQLQLPYDSITQFAIFNVTNVPHACLLPRTWGQTSVFCPQIQHWSLQISFIYTTHWTIYICENMCCLYRKFSAKQSVLHGDRQKGLKHSQLPNMVCNTHNKYRGAGLSVDTSNGSWCIGIKGEMSGTVCVTFTWDIYIYMSCL